MEVGVVFGWLCWNVRLRTFRAGKRSTEAAVDFGFLPWRSFKFFLGGGPVIDWLWFSQIFVIFCKGGKKFGKPKGTILSIAKIHNGLTKGQKRVSAKQIFRVNAAHHQESPCRESFLYAGTSCLTWGLLEFLWNFQVTIKTQRFCKDKISEKLDQKYW